MDHKIPQKTFERRSVAPRPRHDLGKLSARRCGNNQGDMSQDHIHLFIAIPPQVTVSRFVQRLKGKTSHKLLSEYPHLRKTCWGRHFLGARRSGNVTDEVIKQYIEGQDCTSDDNFKVDGEA